MSPRGLIDEAYEKGYRNGRQDWMIEMLTVFAKAHQVTAPPPGWDPLSWIPKELVRRFNEVSKYDETD